MIEMPIQTMPKTQILQLASNAFLYKKTDFYKFRSLLHFIKTLVGDNPQTPEIVNYVDGCAFIER